MRKAYWQMNLKWTGSLIELKYFDEKYLGVKISTSL